MMRIHIIPILHPTRYWEVGKLQKEESEADYPKDQKEVYMSAMKLHHTLCLPTILEMIEKEEYRQNM